PPHRRARDARSQDEGQSRRGRAEAARQPDLRPAGRLRRRAAEGQVMAHRRLARRRALPACAATALLVVAGCRERPEGAASPRATPTGTTTAAPTQPAATASIRQP